jgi:4-aminobutyrate aminotransferase/(S)-3-amino-2-methylpropionate transaminase
MIGIELVKGRTTKEPAAEKTGETKKRYYEHGLLIISCGVLHNILRIMFTLTIEESQLDMGLDIMEDAIVKSS